MSDITLNPSEETVTILPVDETTTPAEETVAVETPAELVAEEVVASAE